MIYLSSFRFPGEMQETNALSFDTNMTCYSTFYPFGVLSGKALDRLEFDTVTILYGGNGCGKTTALNIIGEKLGLLRDAPYNRSSFFDRYVHLCSYELQRHPQENGRFICSDDVFDFMLSLRRINEGIDEKRDEVFDDYKADRKSGFQMRSLEDIEHLKRVNLARSSTRSHYTNSRVMKNIKEHSNGESAYVYFCEKIKENGIYLLDEPENSLSPERQMELLKFIEDSARFYGCQFIIATHSPFFLAMKGAKVYDMDHIPVSVKRWTELSNVRVYYDFFMQHSDEF